MRNISLVALYRPSTNQILWHKFGPRRHQHDIDIYDDTKIGIFNNNTKLDLKLVDINSNIITYDFETDRIEKPFEKLFSKKPAKVNITGNSLISNLEVVQKVESILNKEVEHIKELESTAKLIEKLSILNEYKLNLFKEFSSYKTQKK